MSSLFDRWLRRGRSKPTPSSSPTPNPEPWEPLESFHLAGPDDDVVRLISPAEADRLRRRFLTGRFQAAVEESFSRDPSLHSMTLLVGQYWCDEAEDAVRCELVWSQLSTPDLDAAAASVTGDVDADEVNLGGRSQWNVFGYRQSPARAWDANSYCIPLFASFCPEGGHQEGDYLEFEAPVAIYRRSDPATAEAEMEFVGEIVRPWLDGVQFSFAGDTQPGSDAVVADIERWVEAGR